MSEGATGEPAEGAADGEPGSDADGREPEGVDPEGEDPERGNQEGGDPEEEDPEGFDPTAVEHREIGRQLVSEDTGLGPVVAHFYRGEMNRVTTWRQRLDRTTNLAVTVIAAILTWSFSAPDNPHYLLLVGAVTTLVFLGIESRRYLDYDVWRARARMLQANLFANALDPSQGVEQEDWRAALSRDYRHPRPEIGFGEALAHRLRRVYLPLLGVVSGAWLLRLTVFEPGPFSPAAASLGKVPGVVVVAAMAGLLSLLAAVAVWPGFRHPDEPVETVDTGEVFEAGK